LGILKALKCIFTCVYTGITLNTATFMESDNYFFSFSSRMQKMDPVLNIITSREQRGPLESSLRTLKLPF